MSNLLVRFAIVAVLSSAGASFCGEVPAESPAAPGNHEGVLKVGTLTRDYWYHAPTTYDKSKAAPLLIVLPYGMGRIAHFDDYAHFFPLSEKQGFILAGAESSQECGGWAPYMNCDTKLEPLGSMAGKIKAWADEPAYFRALIDEMEQRFNIDPQRVFICGLSGGGLMTYRLSVLIADRITAAGVVAGAFVWRNEYEQGPIPTPARPVSLIAFHGDADHNVGYEHGANKNITVWSAHENTGFWAKFNGCKPQPETTTLTGAKVDGATVKVEFWPAGKDGPDGASVALYTKAGGGHEWPKYANEIMWDFFMSESARRFGAKAK